MSALEKNNGVADRFGTLVKLVYGIIALAVILAAPAACAQPISDADRARLEAQKEALFQQMLRNPANLDVTFSYADVSARLGDYEAAVSALERMLLFNPNLPRVQLELGALYFRMGSFDLARDYFERAAANKPPPEVRARIDEYMAQIEKAQSRHYLSGYVFLGGQYQTDANVAPGSPFILSPIGPVLLNNQFLKQASGSIFASGSLLYSYDLETQNHDTLDVTSVGYVNHYYNTDVNRLDLALVEVTAGPRFNFPNGLAFVNTPASVKPYAIFDEVGLGEAQYFDAYGTGLEFDQTVWHDLLLKSVFEFRQKNFTDTADRPLSRGLNGSDKLVSLSASKPICDKFRVKPGIRLPRPDNAAGLLHERQLRRYRVLSRSLRCPISNFTLSMGKFGFSRPRLEHLCRAGPVLQHQRQSAGVFAEQPVDATLALRLYPDRTGNAQGSRSFCNLSVI